MTNTASLALFLERVRVYWQQTAWLHGRNVVGTKFSGSDGKGVDVHNSKGRLWEAQEALSDISWKIQE